jgi:hypothetical protein
VNIDSRRLEEREVIGCIIDSNREQSLAGGKRACERYIELNSLNPNADNATGSANDRCLERFGAFGKFKKLLAQSIMPKLALKTFKLLSPGNPSRGLRCQCGWGWRSVGSRDGVHLIFSFEICAREKHVY